jgi:hypothetical protein
VGGEGEGSHPHPAPTVWPAPVCQADGEVLRAAHTPQAGRSGVYPFRLGLMGDVGQTPNSSVTMHRMLDRSPHAILNMGDLYAPRPCTFAYSTPARARAPPSHTAVMCRVTPSGRTTQGSVLARNTAWSSQRKILSLRSSQSPGKR